MSESRSNDLDALFEEFHQAVLMLAHIERTADATHRAREYMIRAHLKGYDEELQSIYRALYEVCERLDLQRAIARKHYDELKDNFLKVIRQREVSDFNDEETNQGDKDR